jgi:glycosyltransferase involved in cell wall biosynthesis
MQALPRMRVLFVSGTTTVGGAARSTHELASLLADRGHIVATLLSNDGAPRRIEIHRRAVNLRVKLANTPFAKIVDAATRRIGAAATPRTDLVGYEGHTAIRPENAMHTRIRAFRPDIVVVNSIDLPAWRQIRDDLERDAIPVVLYIREETGVLHLSHSKVIPDLVVANAEGHVDVVRALGHDAVFVPSVVDCDQCRTTTTRERVLFVNPIPMQGVDIALALARARPDIPFTFAESWSLDPATLTELRADLDSMTNVELRRYDPDAKNLYATTRLLLAPYRYAGRSRTIAEAQCSGIPSLASNRYGPREAVGPGGILCDPDGPIDAWIDALGQIWDDPVKYDQLATAAAAHSQRDELRPETIGAAFEHAIAELLQSRPRPAEVRGR